MTHSYQRGERVRLASDPTQTGTVTRVGASLIAVQWDDADFSLVSRARLQPLVETIDTPETPQEDQ